MGLSLFYLPNLDPRYKPTRGFIAQMGLPSEPTVRWDSYDPAVVPLDLYR